MKLTDLQPEILSVDAREPARLEDAERSLENAIVQLERGERHGRMLLELAELYRCHGHRDAAVHYYRRTDDPAKGHRRSDRVRALIQWGVLLFDAGRTDEAIAVWDNGVRLATERAYDSLFGEDVHDQTEEISDIAAGFGGARPLPAQEFLREAFRQNPLMAYLRNNLGVAYARKNNAKTARYMLTHAIDVTPRGLDYRDPVQNLEELDAVP